VSCDNGRLDPAEVHLCTKYTVVPKVRKLAWTCIKFRRENPVQVSCTRFLSVCQEYNIHEMTDDREIGSINRIRFLVPVFGAGFSYHVHLEWNNFVCCQGFLGGAVIGCRTRDRKVAGSTPGRGAIKSTRSTQPSIPPGLVNRVSACMAGVRRGVFTCVGWQVTLCAPYMQVTSHSSEVGSPQ